ncbi:MAG: hypothetical protein JWO67_865 [Streptosporangiaceae bacterium]|jgi:hypothetical protein|nr:hypothetical protein [Streptosporangiaceae bacterium]
MKHLNVRTLTAVLSAALIAGGAATANAAEPARAVAGPDISQDSGARAHADHQAKDDALARGVAAADRNTKWTLANKVKLRFPTYHTEGLALAGDRMFLSAVQIIEPTKKYPSPQGGYDRTPGKGIGHLFVMDRKGNLQKDITLGEGDMYHPGGIESDGKNIWVDVAQYRPNSSAIIYRVDATTLQVHKQFQVKDHIGGVVLDKVNGHLVGNNWGSRRFYEWTLDGRTVTTWDNPDHFIDYQDCQYVPDGKMICGGITEFPQTPAGGGSGATYELGGIGLVDLRSHAILNEVPFQQWSSAGHVITRNPVKMAADGNRLTLWAAPDNGDEANGTELFTYQATVTPATG